MGSVSFGGKTIYKPGAYSQVSKDQQTVINPGTSRVLAVVGVFDATATGYSTGVLKAYNDPAQAQADLKTGDLLTAMQLAWSARPTDNGPSADVIYAVEVVGTGTGGAVQSSDWQAALDKLQTVRIDGIVVIAGDPSAHAALKTHVDTMSDVTHRKERRGFVGGLAGATVTTSQTNATTDKDSRLCYVHHGIKRYLNGTLTTIPAYVTAALVAGLWAGNDPADPLTFNVIDAAGLESDVLPADGDTLLQAGVIYFEAIPDGSGYRLVQGLTTNVTELSTETVVDAITVEIRNLLEKKYVGKRGSQNAAIYADVVQVLEDCKTRRLWLADDTDGGKVITPAYTAPTVNQSGTNITVDFSGNVVDPVNHVLMTSRFKI